MIRSHNLPHTLTSYQDLRDKENDDLATLITIILQVHSSLWVVKDVREQVSSGRESPTGSFISVSLSNQLLLLMLLYSSLAAIVNENV